MAPLAFWKTDSSNEWLMSEFSDLFLTFFLSSLKLYLLASRSIFNADIYFWEFLVSERFGLCDFIAGGNFWVGDLEVALILLGDEWFMKTLVICYEFFYKRGIILLFSFSDGLFWFWIFLEPNVCKDSFTSEWCPISETRTWFDTISELLTNIFLSLNGLISISESSFDTSPINIS